MIIYIGGLPSRLRFFLKVGFGRVSEVREQGGNADPIDRQHNLGRNSDCSYDFNQLDYHQIFEGIEVVRKNR